MCRGAYYPWLLDGGRRRMRANAPIKSRILPEPCIDAALTRFRVQPARVRVRPWVSKLDADTGGVTAQARQAHSLPPPNGRTICDPPGSHARAPTPCSCG